MAQITGKLVRISGPMIAADDMLGVTMGEIVKVGKLGLMGEVIRIDGEVAYAQVYEDTSGMFLGEPVEAQGAPLSIELGPGLLVVRGELRVASPHQEAVKRVGRFEDLVYLAVPIPSQCDSDSSEPLPDGAPHPLQTSTGVGRQLRQAQRLG